MYERVNDQIGHFIGRDQNGMILLLGSRFGKSSDL